MANSENAMSRNRITLSRNEPYAHTTAPSSKACFTVLYVSLPRPPLRIANFSSRLRERKGRRDTIGSIISVTREFATAEKEAAMLSGLLAGLCCKDT
jgi:hypothetical protein